MSGETGIQEGADVNAVDDDLLPGGSASGPEPPYPRSVWAKVSLLATHIQGNWVLRRLRYRHRAFVRDITPLAEHLESDVFPLLIEDRHGFLVLHVENDRERPRLAGKVGVREFSFPGTEACGAWLSAHGIKEVHLDTRLELGQIVEAFLVLIYAADHLGEDIPADEGYSGWSAPGVAAAMRSPFGYHKFCALLRYKPGEGLYEVEYSYCDLFFSRMVTTYLERGAQHQDHRALFKAVPRAVFLVFTLVALLGIFAAVYPVAGMLAILSAGIGAAALAGAAIHTLASIQYAREHYDMLSQELLAQVGGLSRFPEANPNPLLKLSLEGEVAYANPAARRLARTLALEDDQVHRLLPPDYKALLRQCVEDLSVCHEMAVELDGHVLHYRFSPFPDERFVIAAGTDVTYLKHIERELREVNEHLEELVRERTEALQATEEKRVKLSRFLSPSIVELVVRDGANIELGGQKCEVTTLFCDIRGFTSLSEELPPDKLIKLLNEHFTAMTDVVFQYNGTIDKYIGDEIMALFGAPIAGENDPESAVRAALAMQTLNLEMNRKRAKAGDPTFEVGIGIDTGEVVAGYLGSPERMDYSAAGDHVNTARRVCSLAAGGQVIVTEATYLPVQDTVTATPLGPLAFKGKGATVNCFNVAALRQP
jgi:class 3 adenylate cyclase